MSKTTAPTTAHRRRRRFAPLIWGSGAVAAVLLVLGVNGTLSGWAEATILNDHNDVASAQSVALSESSADGTLCKDTASTATNTATCSTINKYGGVSGGGTEDTTVGGVLPLSPGDDPRTATVTLENTGTGTGTLKLTPGACTNSVNDATGGDTTADYDICTQITVSAACTGDVTLTATTPVTLAAFSVTTIGSLASGDSTACTFTVTLPATTPAGYANQLASQPLTWTLTAA